jgi:hypothetical protein
MALAILDYYDVFDETRLCHEDGFKKADGGEAGFD